MTKVLVTGADGFIGSHMVETLVAAGHEVRALVFYNSFGSWGWLDHSPIKNKIEVISGDVRDPHFCHKIVKDIDTVFHLAALIAIPYSYVAPDSYIATNVTGTLNICQAALEAGCRRILHTSTSEVYGTAKYVPIDEDHPLQPQSPYSASKIGADAIAKSFHASFGLPLTIVRPFNTYGPRQSARAVIPTIIAQIAAGEREIKLGDVSTTRDFNYVTDTCNGFLKISETSSTIGQTLNISTNDEISVLETLIIIKDVMSSDVHFVTDEARLRPKNSEVFRLLGDNTRLKSLTGFKSKVSLRAGLSETVNWFSNPKNLSYYKANQYNV